LCAHRCESFLTTQRAMQAKIFISYRRDDDPSAAARVGDSLATTFGRDNLFIDVNNLRAGQRFDQELNNALAASDVLIAILGRRWLELLKNKMASGERDYVREEIARALQRNIIVVPVRVGREGQLLPLPHVSDLPEEIHDLVLFQKQDVTYERFGRDIAELIEAILTVRRSAEADKTHPAPESSEAARPKSATAQPEGSLYKQKKAYRFRVSLPAVGKFLWKYKFVFMVLGLIAYGYSWYTETEQSNRLREHEEAEFRKAISFTCSFKRKVVGVRPDVQLYVTILNKSLDKFSELPSFYIQFSENGKEIDSRNGAVQGLDWTSSAKTPGLRKMEGTWMFPDVAKGFTAVKVGMGNSFSQQMKTREYCDES
jgi:TIR domain